MTTTEVEILMVLAKHSSNSDMTMTWSMGMLITKKSFSYSKRKRNTQLANEIWRQKAAGKKQISFVKYLESTNLMT